MLKVERQQQILSFVTTEGAALVSKLSKHFKVSPVTIRRDLDELANKNLILRDHGGAVSLQEKSGGILTGVTDLQPSVLNEVKLSVEPANVLAIAQLIHAEGAIILDWGSLAMAIPQHIPNDLRAIVITNSPTIAMSFTKHSQVEVRVIGGRLRNNTIIPTSTEEIEFLQMTRSDLCILGSCNIDPKVGISVSDPEQARVMRAMITHANKVVAAVSPKELDNSARFIVSSLNKLTHLVVANNVPEEMLKPYEDLGVIVVHA